VRRVALLSLLLASGARADLRVPEGGTEASRNRCAQLFRDQLPWLKHLGDARVLEFDDGIALAVGRHGTIRWEAKVMDSGKPRATISGEARSSEGAWFRERAQWALDQCLSGEVKFGFGAFRLPDGWRAVDEQGIDSRVGRILDETGATVLQYDHGMLAGEYGPPGPSEKNGMFYFTIRATGTDGPGNFWGPAKDRERAMRFLRTLHTETL
jgi:hypothetical protein